MKKTDRRRKGTPEARKLGRWLTRVRTEELQMSRSDLAEKLDVDRSTVASWENGDYQLSAENLIKLGNVLPFPADLDAWQRAGLDVAKLWPKETSPGMFRLTMGLFPFEAGDAVGIDDSLTDPWDLIGSLVVVRFTRYPERTEVELSQREVERLRARPKVDIAELEKQHAIRRQFLERYGSKEALETFDADDAAAEKLAERWTPDEHGTIRLDATQAGWLRLQFADDPDFVTEPPPPRRPGDRPAWPEGQGLWRLVLQGASLKGVRVPLIGWKTKATGILMDDHSGVITMANEDLGINSAGVTALREKEILGQVRNWMRATGLRARPPDRAEPKDASPKAKSRKGPK